MVSVIVPVHDVAEYIGTAIGSLRAQEFSDFEALVIDDGSTDGSAATARAAFAGDPRFRLITQRHLGLSAARNRGLDLARGQFVAFLDGDDAYAPGFLAQMVAAAAQLGADWAASAILLCYPDGREIAHSAIHGDPAPQGSTRPIALDDAVMAARLFPSAWNKIYRRALIGDLRFDEGTWFEDHAFYWQLVTRTQTLVHVPRALYRHRRDRPGQITGADDERIMDQIGVLERLARLVPASGKANPRTALEQLATRLIHERAQILRQPARRQRFLAAAAGFLANNRLAWTPGHADDVDAALGPELAGACALSVLILHGGAGDDPRARAQTLSALARQELQRFEIITAEPPAPPGPVAHSSRETRHCPADAGIARMLAMARGRYLCVLRPGDQPGPEALRRWIDRMERSGAALGLAAGSPTRATRPGAGRSDLLPLAPADALRLNPARGTAVFHRRLLAGHPFPALAPSDPVCLQALVLAAALRAPASAYACVLPETTLCTRRAPPPPGATRPQETLHALAMIRAAIPECAALPQGWERVLLGRMLHAALAGQPSRAARLALALRGGLAARRNRLPTAERSLTADPGVPGYLRRALGLAAAPQNPC